MAQPMHIQVTGLITDRHPTNESITIRKIDDGNNIIGQWRLDFDREDNGVVNPADIQVTGLPAVISTDTEVTIVKTDRIGEFDQWEVQEQVAPPQEPVAPAQETVGQTSNVDGGRRSRRQGGSKKKSKGWGGSKKQKKHGGSKKQKNQGGSKKQKKRKGSKKRR